MAEINMLVAVIIIDYITGVLTAVCERKINSAIGRKGIFRKIGIILCAVFCSYLDNLNILVSAPITPVVVTFFAINEGFSILENLQRLGIPIPKQLTELFLNQQKKDDK